jgi:hypothetical protein
VLSQQSGKGISGKQIFGKRIVAANCARVIDRG